MLMKEEKVKRQHLGLSFYRYGQLVKGCSVIHVRHAVIHTLERRGKGGMEGRFRWMPGTPHPSSSLAQLGVT